MFGVVVKGRTSVGTAVTQRPAARAAFSHNVFHKVLGFLTLFFFFFTSRVAPTHGAVGLATAARYSWHSGGALQLEAGVFPLFSSHRQITESTLLLLQPPDATGLHGCSADGFCRVFFFFSLAPACTWKTSLASVVLSEKNHRNVGESFKNVFCYASVSCPMFYFHNVHCVST